MGQGMDGSWDAKLESPQNAAGVKMNDIIAKHMLISRSFTRLQL